MATKTGKVPVKFEKENRFEREHPTHRSIQWSKALPFFKNARGLLIHRVRSVRSHIQYGKHRHDSLSYLCGNGCSVSEGSEFLAEPPADRLLCMNCEAMAKKLGLPSADRIAGRHVHVGKVRVEQTCCQDQREAN
jgi:hypothetical protein